MNARAFAVPGVESAHWDRATRIFRARTEAGPTFSIQNERRNAVSRETHRRDVAPVIAAEALLHHGMRDDVIISYLARTWDLDDRECFSAVEAAHVLLRRELAAYPPTSRAASTSDA
jgi:hypothetical protein